MPTAATANEITTIDPYVVDMDVPLTCEQFRNGETTHVTDLRVLFNPLHNRLCIPGITIAEYCRHLRALYTRENINKNLGFFVWSSGLTKFRGTELEFIKRLVDDLKDEHLYLLGFTAVSFDRTAAKVKMAAVDGNRWARFTYDFQYLYYTAASEEYRYLITEAFPRLAQLTELSCKDNRRDLLNGAEKTSCAHQLGGWFSDMYRITMPGRTVNPSEALRLLEGGTDGTKIVVDCEGNCAATTLYKYSTNTNRKAVKRVLEYRASPLDYIYNTFDEEKGKQANPFLGVELELSTDYCVADLIDAQEKLFAIYKHDTSVSGSKNNRMEMVTLPMTFNEHRRHFASWFKALDMKKMDTSVETTNGFHVHIDARHFGPDPKQSFYLRKLVWFITFPGNASFMLQVSERSERSMERWAPIPDYQMYSKKGTAFVKCLDAVRRIRGAVHIETGKPTVELRLFKGIVSFATVLKNLEFTMAALEFCRGASYNELTVPHFLDWLEATPKNRYTCLKAFVSKLDMSGVKEASELIGHIFCETDPYRIRDILKDKNITIKNSHIRFLNKQIGRKVFISNNTGGLEVSDRWQGKVAYLDSALIERYSNPHSTQRTA